MGPPLLAVQMQEEKRSTIFYSISIKSLTHHTHIHIFITSTIPILTTPISISITPYISIIQLNYIFHNPLKSLHQYPSSSSIFIPPSILKSPYNFHHPLQENLQVTLPSMKNNIIKWFKTHHLQSSSSSSLLKLKVIKFPLLSFLYSYHLQHHTNVSSSFLNLHFRISIIFKKLFLKKSSKHSPFTPFLRWNKVECSSFSSFKWFLNIK